MQGLFFRTLEKFIARPDLPVDERRKRIFLVIFLGAAIPTTLSFGLWNLVNNGLTLVVYLLFLTAFASAIILIALRYVQYLHGFYRVGVALVLLLLSYVVATGAGYEVGYVWFYFHPLTSFFLFGGGEGFLWVLISWIIGLFLTIFNLGSYDYSPHTGIRFMVSYTLVSVLAYGLEAARQHYYDQLAAEKLALEAALQQVKTLRDLLPICASCKKIRDDGGYWHQVESYMRDHAGVEFSHSICPDCRVKLYPLRVRGSDHVA